MAVGSMTRLRQRAIVPRLAVVIENHFLIQGFRVGHQEKTFRRKPIGKNV
jgi:hypothetical protein